MRLTASSRLPERLRSAKSYLGSGELVASFSHCGKSREYFLVPNYIEVGRRHADRGVIPSPYRNGMMPLGTGQNGNFPSGS